MKKVYKHIALTLLICFGCLANAFAQFPWSSGFETADPAFTYNSTTNTAASIAGVPRTGSKCGGMTTAGSTYDASIITPSFNFTACKKYTINVYARIIDCTGQLRIIKSATGTNAAMNAASGSDILLDAASNNITSTTYSLFTATYVPSVNETMYIGFQMQGTGGGPCGSINMYIDDISITETAVVPVGGTASASSTTVACAGSSTITLTGSAGTIQWQLSTDGGTTWNDIAGQTAATLATGPLYDLSSQFRAVLTGYSGGCATANSTVATVTNTGSSTLYWRTSGATTAWATAANWWTTPTGPTNPASAPNSTCIDVVIQASNAYPVTASAITVHNMTVNATASVNHTGGAFNHYGDLINNGNIIDDASFTNFYGSANKWGGTGTYLNGATQVGYMIFRNGSNYTLTGDPTILQANPGGFPSGGLVTTGSLSFGTHTLTVTSVWYCTFYNHFNTGMLNLMGGGSVDISKSDYGTGTLWVNSSVSNFGFNLQDDYYNIWFSNSAGATKFGVNAQDVFVKNDFWIKSGSVDLSASGTNAIAIGGDFINDATLSAATSIIRMQDFDVAQVQNITSTNNTITTFNELDIKNSGPGVRLQIAAKTNATAQGILRMSSGPLYLNGHRFTVMSPVIGAISRNGVAEVGYAVSESDSAINNSILEWDIGNTGNGAHVFPFGTAGGSYIPVTFNNTGDVGNVSIATRPTTNTVCTSPVGVAGTCNKPWAGLSNVAAVGNMNDVTSTDISISRVIDRWWDITSSKASPIPSTTLSLSYTGAENTMTYPVDILCIQHWNGSVWDNGNNGGNGSYITTNTAGTQAAGAHTVTGASTFSYFSPYVLVNIVTVLPVDLLSFSATCEGDKVLTKWETASEQNNHYFTLEKSMDGETFYPVTNITGAGTSSIKKEYSAIDHEPFNSMAYYRLKQTDYNGKSQTFKAIGLEACGNKNGFAVYPNPASGSLKISMAGQQGDKVSIVVKDLLGRDFYSQDILMSNDKETIAVDISDKFAAGVYFVVATFNDITYKKKVVIK